MEEKLQPQMEKEATKQASREAEKNKRAEEQLAERERKKAEADLVKEHNNIRSQSARVVAALTPLNFQLQGAMRDKSYKNIPRITTKEVDAFLKTLQEHLVEAEEKQKQQAPAPLSFTIADLSVFTKKCKATIQTLIDGLRSLDKMSSRK